MKQDDLPEEILIMRETLMALIICASIPPERIQELPDKVYSMVGSPGTTHGRWELPNFEERPLLKPVKCPDYEGRWHYILFC